MSRKIFLPELLSINIKNYTLYPNGLDYSYDFVKGVNLVVGGNGMGKTTFVNMIKFALIGPYRQQYSFTRTYRDKKIEKRLLSKFDYFSSRMDRNFIVNEKPTVTLKFRLNQTEVMVTRALDESMAMKKCVINGAKLEGIIVPHGKYEDLQRDEKKQTLLYKYEMVVTTLSKLPFDDLIFFVNEVLFFGEDHKTILWGDNQNINVQNELFNKYFNDPKLDFARQEAERQAKYYDSLSRHRSEDMRAINKVLAKLSVGSPQENKSANFLDEILRVGKELEKTDQILTKFQQERNSIYREINTIRHEKNELSLKTLDADRRKEQIESNVNTTRWGKVNPRYSVYLRNIHQNHLCPLCNQMSESLYAKVETEVNKCFVCGQELKSEMSAELSQQYEKVLDEQKELYKKIEQLDNLIRSKEEKMQKLDSDYEQVDNRKRELSQRKRELEYANSMSGSRGDIQAFYDEITRLNKEKDNFQKESILQRERATQISQKIRQSILQNVRSFSCLFSEYAELFLGVKCELTYDKDEQGEERFFPVIDNQVRWHEEELSESQRFFVDHSFRMSILTFFYTTPAFYIIETPDSSLDVSYEYNAAQVFRHFLRIPNSLIITSNLNNSSFLQDLVKSETEKIQVSMVGLLDIAKQSAIQNTSDPMKKIYSSLKQKISYERRIDEK